MIRETRVTGARNKNGKVIKKRYMKPRNGVISISNTTENCKYGSIDSYLVNNALFDISAPNFFSVNAYGLLSTMDVLREYAVKRNLHYRKNMKIFAEKNANEAEISARGCNLIGNTRML